MLEIVLQKKKESFSVVLSDKSSHARDMNSQQKHQPQYYKVLDASGIHPPLSNAIVDHGFQRH